MTEQEQKVKEIEHPEIKKGSIFDKVGITNIQEDNIFNTINKLLDVHDIELKTALSQNEVVVFTKALWFSDKFDLPVLKLYVTKMMILKVSQDRKGRTELIEAISSGIAKLIKDKEKEKAIEV